MSEYTQVRVESPCIGICTIDESNGYCLGCYRTGEEIKEWFDMSQADKKKLMLELNERQLTQAQFD